MRNRNSSIAALIAVVGLCAAAASVRAASPAAPVSMVSGRVSIAGTSNIHPYTASTSDVRIVRVQLTNGVTAGDWADVVKTGAIEKFEISIPASTLSSPKEGIDKTMHKALKVAEHPDITFRLSRLEGAGGAGAFRGVGMLEIAGVAREVALELRAVESGSTLTVKGEVQLLMTDYGVTPPKAMLGMLKTDPKVTVTFETVFALAANAPVATN
jgi:YceI-like protein